MSASIAPWMSIFCAGTIFAIWNTSRSTSMITDTSTIARGLTRRWTLKYLPADIAPVLAAFPNSFHRSNTTSAISCARLIPRAIFDTNPELIRSGKPSMVIPLRFDRRQRKASSMCFSVTKTLDGSIFVRTKSLRPEQGDPLRGQYLWMSFPRHQEIFPKQRSVRLAPDAPCPRLDEFPVGYSLTGCSPALPVSASPADEQSPFVLPQFRGFWPSSIVLPMSRNTCYPCPRPEQAGGRGVR